MRRRSDKNKDLPPRCERLPSGSVRYRPLGGAAKVIAGKSATLPEIFQVYEKATSGIFKGLEWLAAQWYESHDFSMLSKRTQADYRIECSKKPIQVFADYSVDQIQPGDIGQYLDWRVKQSVRRSNLELVWFRHVMAYGVHIGALASNPCRDLKAFKQPQKRRTAPSDYDYKCMYAKAAPAVRVAMEIAYCTGLRQGDVLRLRWEDIEKSIKVKEGKTGREYFKEISPRLSKALEDAKKLPGQPFGGWVVRNNKGNQYTSNGFQANWKRARTKMSAHRRFTFHSLRHKAITDATGNKQLFSMHKDARMLGVYDHELPISPSH